MTGIEKIKEWLEKGQDGKRYSVKELSVQFEMHENTIRKHIRKLFSDMPKSKKLLDKAQVTVLIKSLQISNGSVENRRHHAGVVGVQTELTPFLEIEMIERERAALDKKEAGIWRGLYEKEAALHKETQAVLEGVRKELEVEKAFRQVRENGLNHYQMIAEAGGLVKSDKEDVKDTYSDWSGYRNKK